MERLSLRLRIFLFFALVGLGGAAAVIGALAWGYTRLGDPAALSAFITSGLVACFVILGMSAGIWLLFDEHVAKAVERLASDMRSRAHADVAHGLDGDAAKYLGDLAPAAAAVATGLSETKTALQEAVARETRAIEDNRAQLEAILSDVEAGIILCTDDHQIAFYNGHAAALFRDHAPGLDRSVFRTLKAGPILHAYARLRSGAPGEASDLLCVSESGQTLSGRMRLFSAGGRGGYVLVLRDVTKALRGHLERDAALASALEEMRRPAAGLQTILSVLGEDLQEAERTALQTAMREETEALVAQVNGLIARRAQEDRSGAWWPMPLIHGEDIRAGLETGLGLTATADPMSLPCDGYALVQLACNLGQRLRTEGRGTGLAASLSKASPGATLDLTWEGAPLAVTELEHWLDAPFDENLPAITGRRLLDMHGAESWPERAAGSRNRLRIALPRAETEAAAQAYARSAAVYDFALMTRPAPPDIAQSPLRSLHYVVFDTETTGLSVLKGDRIVQIAAVRVVNGRIVPEEIFNTLVDPERSIPPESTKIHHITDADVAGAPTLATAGKSFHSYCEGAVLVAHNAPFDIGMLRRDKGEFGEMFDHPVLDTVLLSAVVFGQSAEHSLDALAARLGVTIPPELRHTAHGDALATAEVFLKLLPMMEAVGIETFADATRKTREHGRLLADLN
ncbi:exonuclease domain-containing protein [Pseudoruegeria sp. SHC-113]|uniref:3'-5' exonuclease n=1 Tax=Pseudoruegeria sp. SHC-113 TaxID=2855439 RepID=UPI0021BB4174|nr:exonuclease domain-containing protein [Pseudoruegeria sp. SHC-113]MCT8161985.1 DNA polymerase III subunit epsilon [Pseudoruegeria sp. SHC-113]